MVNDTFLNMGKKVNSHNLLIYIFTFYWNICKLVNYTNFYPLPYKSDIVYESSYIYIYIILLTE